MKWSNLLASAVLVGGVIVLVLVTRPPGGVHLIRLPDVPPTPELAIAADELAWDLTDQSGRVASAPAELRRQRNALVRQWSEALAAHDAGTGRWRDAERIELDVWVARHRTGEIPAAEMHRNWARLIQHEHVRAGQQAAHGRATADDVARLELYHLRELFAAGDPGGDTYPVRRTAYVAARKEQLTLLVRAGSERLDVAQLEMNLLDREFPEPGAASG